MCMQADPAPRITEIHLWATVFSFLSFEHVLSQARRVCKTFHNACDSPLAFQKHVPIFTANSVTRWAPFLTLCTSLEFAATKNTLSALTSRVGNVKRLVLWTAMALASPDEQQALGGFANSIDRLTALTIIHGGVVDTADEERERTLMLSFAKHFAHLQQLVFKDESCRMHVGQPALLQPMCPHLRSLRWMSSVFPTDAMYDIVAQHCPNLTDLRLYGHFNSQNRGPSDAALRALARGCPRLESLRLFSNGITASGLDHLLTRCIHLSRLNLADSSLPEFAVSPVLASHAQLTRLSCIGRQGAHANPEDFFRYGSPHITHITVNGDEHVGKAELECVVRKSPNVRELKVMLRGRLFQPQFHVSCADVQALRRQFPSLQRVTLVRKHISKQFPYPGCSVMKQGDNRELSQERVAFEG